MDNGMEEWDIKEINITETNKKSDASDDNLITEEDVNLVNIDNSKIICCGYKQNLIIKRSFLPIVPGGVIILVYYESIRHSFIYFPLIICICSFIIFVNYPILVIHSNLRPVYFGNDLFVDRNRLPMLELTKKDKQIILKNIKWLLIVLFSLLTAALSDYWLFKTQHVSSYFEIFGVTGGILKIFQMVAHIGAGYIMSKTRKLAQKKARCKSHEEITIELKEIQTNNIENE